MKSLCLKFALGFAVLPLLASAANEKLVADGQTVVFLGDSITCYGAVKPDGYVKLVVSGLAANGINVKWFGAGVAGQKAWHMKDRFERDVLARKPDLVTISAGVNDVWFPGADCTPEKFRADMQDMITRAKAAGIRVVLLTPSSAYANEGDDLRIQNYAKCVCELASANGVVLADTRKAFRALVDDPASPKIDAQGRKATVDGVHLAPTGNRAFAREVLRAFGLNDAERAKAEEEWNTKTFCPVSAHVAVPYPAYCALESATDARKHRFEDCCNELCRKGVAAMIADQKFDPPVAAEPVRPEVKSDQADIVYLGDRLVDFDRNSRSGLCRQMRLAGAVSGKGRALTSVIPTGVLSLNAAWDAQIAARKPKYLVVATYVFEIFSVKVDDAVAEVKTLVEKASAAGTKVILVTTRPTKNPDAEKKFNSALRALADGKRVFVLDQREILNDVVARRSANPYASFASVGFELNPSANLTLGRTLLPMLGFTSDEIEKTYAKVNTLPDFADIWANTCLTFGEYDALLKLANRRGLAFPALVDLSLRRGADFFEGKPIKGE